jgi:hypothetical protein
MKALTIKQPWASLVCTPRQDNPLLGIKDIENRTWRTNYRGRIYVHAGADKNVYTRHFTDDQLKICQNECESGNLSTIDLVPLGAIIGEVDIIDCVQNHPSIWAMPDHWNWVLANPVLYDKPILNVKGALSFWEWNHELNSLSFKV